MENKKRKRSSELFDVDHGKNPFGCDICNELLVDPVTIPCGSNVCKKHLDELIIFLSTGGRKSYKCVACQEDHFMPENDFQVNTQIEACIRTYTKKLKYYSLNERHNIEILRAKENVAKIESLQLDSDVCIGNYFEEIKRKVELKKDKLKNNIDKYYEDVLVTIEDAKRNCIMSKGADKITENIRKYKKNLDDFESRLGVYSNGEKSPCFHFSAYVQNYENLIKSVAVLNGNFKTIISEYQDSLVGDYTFKFNEMRIEDVFGSLINTQQVKQTNFSLGLMKQFICITFILI